VVNQSQEPDHCSKETEGRWIGRNNNYDLATFDHNSAAHDNDHGTAWRRHRLLNERRFET
jgi:hypothetical protein